MAEKHRRRVEELAEQHWRAAEEQRRRVEELAELERQRWKAAEERQLAGEQYRLEGLERQRREAVEERRLAAEERGEFAEHPRLDELEEQPGRARKLN